MGAQVPHLLAQILQLLAPLLALLLQFLELLAVLLQGRLRRTRPLNLPESYREFEMELCTLAIPGAKIAKPILAPITAPVNASMALCKRETILGNHFNAPGNTR